MPIQSDMVGCLLGRVVRSALYQDQPKYFTNKMVQKEDSYRQYILCCKNHFNLTEIKRERERGGFQTVARSIIKWNGDQQVRGWSKRNNNREKPACKIWKDCLQLAESCAWGTSLVFRLKGKCMNICRALSSHTRTVRMLRASKPQGGPKAPCPASYEEN